MRATKLAQLSAAEYLAQELQSPIKHEYIDGEIYALAGASRRHNLLAANLLSHAHRVASERKGCQVFGSDMKVRVEARNSYYYPDVSGSCDPDDRDEQYLTRPCFIIEVSSPATASIDRREKRASYETLPSLHDYVIVNQDAMLVHAYRRGEDGWTACRLRDPADIVTLSCLELQLTLEQIYRGVELPLPLMIREPASLDYYTLSAWAQSVSADPSVMGGKPRIRDLRVTVGTVLGLLAAGASADDILAEYPGVEPQDIRAALAYAALRTEGGGVPLTSG